MAPRPVDLVKWCHRRLLPEHREEGWIPYLWLVYLLFFIIFAVRASAVYERWLSFAGLGVFLLLYFRGYWVRGTRLLVVIGCISALGLALIPINPTASMFQIYAASFCGRLASRRAVFISLACILLPFVAVVKWFDIPPNMGLFAVFFSVLVAVINMYYSEVSRKNAELKLSQEEIKKLAALAERERIARDLHDLLGHTLSVITLKAELAARLLERGDARAGMEIREVERISRQALRQVREAVVGYRQAGLGGELANARLAFDLVEILFEYDPPPSGLNTAQEAVLAMVLREAVTNIVRHADADTCRIRFLRTADQLKMVISDDGRGGDLVEGAGIAGMRERLAGIGGSLVLSQAEGVCLEIVLTVDGPDESLRTEKSVAGVVPRLQPEQPT